MVIWVKIFKTEKHIEMQLVRLTEVCNKVCENNYYNVNSVKTALLLSNVINADHQNSCFVYKQRPFLASLWVLVGVLGKFYE